MTMIGERYIIGAFGKGKFSKKRIISRILFDCSIKMNTDPDKVDYVLGRYYLKQNL